MNKRTMKNLKKKIKKYKKQCYGGAGSPKMTRGRFTGHPMAFRKNPIIFRKQKPARAARVNNIDPILIIPKVNKTKQKSKSSSPKRGRVAHLYKTKSVNRIKSAPH